MAKFSKMGWRERVMLAAFIVAAVVFLPVTALLFVGMLPTVVARLTDKTKERTKVMTVGFMNFAGCYPFVYQLIESGLKLQNVMAILSDPMTVVLIYSAALLGYGVEWLVTNMVAGLMVQKGRNRLENITKIQENMSKQWGREVSGEIPLDPYGFPLEQGEPPPKA